MRKVLGRFNRVSEETESAKQRLCDLIDERKAQVENELKAFMDNQRKVDAERSKRMKVREDELDKIHKISGIYRPVKIVQGGAPGSGKGGKR